MKGENKMIIPSNNKLLGLMLLIIVLLGIKPLQAEPNLVTNMGADLSYQCIGQNSDGNNQYELMANVYYHCVTDAEVFSPPGLQLLVRSASLGEEFLYILTQTTIEEEVSPLCPEQSGNSNCNGGAYPGVKKFSYHNIGNLANPFVLPAQANDWVVSFTDLYRNPEITNLQNPNDESFYIEATINNEGGGCWHSPNFIKDPVPYFCTGVPSTFTQGAISLNVGTTVKYKSIQPLSYKDTTIPYVSPFSEDIPLNVTSGTYYFDPETGEIAFESTKAQYAVIAIEITETNEDNIVIARTMRNAQIVVIEGCSNQAVDVTVLQNQYGICPGKVLNFDIVVAGEVSDDEIVSNVAADFPGATITESTNSNGDRIFNFEWIPDTEGVFNLILDITDNSCPVIYNHVEVVPINVTTEIIVESNEYTHCTSSDPLKIELQGGGPFTWEPVPTNLSANGAVAYLAAETSIDYYISNDCGSTQNINVNVLEGFTIDAADEHICIGESLNLQAILSPSDRDFTYTWNTNIPESLSCTNCATPSATPTENAMYTLYVKDEYGCEQEHNILVDVAQAPNVSLSPSTTYVAQKGQAVSIVPTGNFYSIEWDNGSTANELTLPIHETTTITAIVRSEKGCEATVSTTVYFDCTRIVLPTAFSPNNDGINDNFGLLQTAFESFEHIRIFNRWGQMIFETSDANQRWDGIFKGETLPIGVYNYQIAATCDGKTINHEGKVTLVR